MRKDETRTPLERFDAGEDVPGSHLAAQAGIHVIKALLILFVGFPVGCVLLFTLIGALGGAFSN